MKRLLWSLLALSVALGAAAQADPDITIGDINIPTGFKWGKHTTGFEVTNHSDWFRFVTVETEITFEGAYLTPKRIVHSHFPLEPGQTKTIEPVVEVPGNYGKATLFIRIYDVIDTLDALMESQKLFEQGFKLTFHVPEALQSYFQDKITLPPMVNNNPIWDNEFAHLLPVLLSEGKSLNDVAKLTGADMPFIQDVTNDMIAHNFLYRNKDSSVVPRFPIITPDYAQKGKDLAEKASDLMADRIVKNLPGYQRVIDSLVASGSLTTDTADFMNGGTVLYSKYPVIGGLLLWFDQGRSFVVGRDLLEIFKQTDPCNALIGDYMYAVRGGDYFNGHHYYNFSRTTTEYEVHWGDEIPAVECMENFQLHMILVERRDYHFPEEFNPESFVVSAEMIAPALNALSSGMEDVSTMVRDGLIALSADHGFPEVSVAERYWFWNLFASRTLTKLVERGVLTRRGNGQFRFHVQD